MTKMTIKAADVLVNKDDINLLYFIKVNPLSTTHGDKD